MLCLLTVGLSGEKASAAYGGGSGWSQDDPFLISSPAHLLEISSHPEHLDKYFKLTADIDLADITWTPDHRIGIASSSPFSGVFDGDGHAVDNLSFSAESATYIGLFGYLTGTVRNLSVVNVTLTIDNAVLVGGLAGNSTGHIENCHTTYAITTGNNAQLIGGLVGSASGSIENSSSRGTLTTGTGCVRIGGLAGGCSARITDSHVSGAVQAGSSSQYIGGLVGSYSGLSIDHCCSNCSVTGSGTAGTVGGLVGYYTQGDITHCYSLAPVHGSSFAGGLVGSVRISTFGVISNCFSSSAVSISGTTGNAGGLVGYAEALTLTDCTSSGPVSGPDAVQLMGGLAGSIRQLSTIENCSSSSSVTGKVNAKLLGGLLGAAYNSTVRRCSSSGAVVSGGGPGAYLIGGLIGNYDIGPVEYCYSLGLVDAGAGSNWVGGLIGQTSNVTMTHCFAAGEVRSGGTFTGGLIGEAKTTLVITCFWDSTSTGKTISSGGGKGLTTTAMQSESTFTSAGWDFVSTWKMYAYPGLAWEPELGTSGEFSASVSAGETEIIEFSVFALRDVTIQWTLGDIEDGGWIAAAAPVTGTSTGPDDAATVQLTLDSAGLQAGDYSQELLITGDNGETRQMIIRLHVFHRVQFDALAGLATHWGTGCDFGLPCKVVDWYVDGKIDMEDLSRLADGWLGERIVTVRAEVTDGFESGDFTNLNWRHSGDASWQIVSSGAYEGSAAARSGAIGDGQMSVLEVTLDLTGWEINTVGFAVRPSSETSYDFLRFYIDDVVQDHWSGNWVDYTYRTFSITPGVRTLKWVYSKDSGGESGEDCAWIDAIRVYAR
jgi:hypothetical protein